MRDLGRQARPGPLCPSLLAAARRGCGPAKAAGPWGAATAPSTGRGEYAARPPGLAPARSGREARLRARRRRPGPWRRPSPPPGAALAGGTTPRYTRHRFFPFGVSVVLSFSGRLLVRSGGSRFRSGGVGAGGPLLVAASGFVPFRGWWSPGREVLAAWASVGVRLPRRVPVFVAWRFGAPGVRAPRSFAVVLPSGRVLVVVSRSVSLAPSAVWAGEWARRGGVGWSVVRSAVPSAVRACWPGEVSCGC